MQNPTAIIKNIIIGVDKRKIVGFIAAFILLLTSYVLLAYSTKKMAEHAYRVDHTNKIILNLETFLAQIREIGYNFRGYAITREERYAEDFYVGWNRAKASLQTLKGLISDDEEQESKLDSLMTLSSVRLKGTAEIMEAFRLNPALKDSMLHYGYVNREGGTMPSLVKRMEYREAYFLADRKKDVDSSSKAIEAINFTSLAIAILLAIYSFITYIAENRERQKSENKAQQYRAELENRIGELSRANKELTKLRSIEKFASTGRIARTMAHEVRNPLTNIHLATEQIRESIPLNEENEMLLQMIKRNSDRINQLISDLLNATKFSELNFKEVTVGELLDNALEQAADRIELSQTHVIRNYPTNDPSLKVNVDFEKLSISFLNIIVNAIEAMEPGKGILEITTQIEQEHCKVTIKDNGSGMNEETVSKLFEPFFTSKQKGNGLGLTNTQNIILNHKGTIEVASQLGLGTSFSISLQLVNPL
jgi:signal transduction histidine kinase